MSAIDFCCVCYTSFCDGADVATLVPCLHRICFSCVDGINVARMRNKVPGSFACPLCKTKAIAKRDKLLERFLPNGRTGVPLFPEITRRVRQFMRTIEKDGRDAGLVAFVSHTAQKRIGLGRSSLPALTIISDQFDAPGFNRHKVEKELNMEMIWGSTEVTARAPVIGSILGRETYRDIGTLCMVLRNNRSKIVHSAATQTEDPFHLAHVKSEVGTQNK